MGRNLLFLSLGLIFAGLWIMSALHNQSTVAPDEHTVRAQITAVAAPTRAG